MPLPRTRLLARLFAAEPRLVRFVAPPGHGKSSLARLFARRFERHAIVDCRGITNATDFANRTLSALAGEIPGGSDAITQFRLRLHTSEADAGAWNRALLDVWKSRSEQALLVVEHAEAIADNGPVLALIGDMFAARPADRVVLISTRAALPLRYSHFVAPHQTLTFSRSELRFSNEEAAEVFAGTDLAADAVERAVRLADGWPIALLFLARYAQYDASIDRLIERLRGVDAAELYERLGNEVLAEFGPEMMSVMLATASIPNASLEDISAATGIHNVTSIVDRLLHLPGFISSETGAYQVHPLLQGALRAQSGADQTNYLLRAAAQYEHEEHYLRAAELHAISGDTTAAARALNRLPFETLQHPSARLVDVLTAIEMPFVCTQPNLWVATFPDRRRRVETIKLYDEAQALLHAISPNGAPALERRLRVRLAILAQELERLTQARSVMESTAFADSLTEAPEERQLALMTLALIAAKQGRFAESDHHIDAAESIPGTRHLHFENERTQIASERARLFGDWHDVLRSAEEALYTAQRGGDNGAIIEAARAVAEAAWYCDDDARVTSANQMLEDCGDPEVRNFPRYVASLVARETVDAPPLALQVARLHAALSTADAEVAQQLFNDAIEGIDAFENAFPRVVMRVCAALLLPNQRRRLLEARMIGQSIESPPLEASLELLIDSAEPADHGIFQYLAARIARSPLKARREGLFIDLSRGAVRRGEETLHVSDRGLELLAAFALHAPNASKEEIAATIWPALDADAALNALKMCVSRTRAQLGDKEAIVNTKRGYALNGRVAVDVLEFEQLLHVARSAATPGDVLRRQVEEAVRALEDRRAHTANWAWFLRHNSRLEELRSQLAVVLERRATG